MKTGTENWRTGCNAPDKPEHVGQLIKFISPFNRNVVLTDIGYINKYGHLVWKAYIPEISEDADNG